MRVYYVVIVPAICDFVATYMMNVGLLWINAYALPSNFGKF